MEKGEEGLKMKMTKHGKRGRRVEGERTRRKKGKKEKKGILLYPGKRRCFTFFF
jgi:hypothetical protein